MGERHMDDEPSLRALDRIIGRQRGPVEILCREIEFDFDPRLERIDVLVAFVGALVAEIAQKREIEQHVSRLDAKLAPSAAGREVLALAHDMLRATTVDDLRRAAEEVHDASWRLNPDDAYPTDHDVDMLSSCASAIRFGLETPCQSRHAADAANHVWKQRYRIGLFDGNTLAWSKAWARTKLMEALIGLLPPAPISPTPSGETP